MNEKLHNLGMSFDEALRRIAKTPKKAIDEAAPKLEKKRGMEHNKASERPKKPPRGNQEKS